WFTAMKISFPNDCGNAPKKIIIKDLIVALAEGKLSEADQYLADDLNWEIKGSGDSITNKAGLSSMMQFTAPSSIAELSIKSIITHGRDAAAEGIYVLEDGTRLAFCHIYQFNGFAKSAQVKHISSYII